MATHAHSIPTKAQHGHTFLLIFSAQMPVFPLTSISDFMPQKIDLAFNYKNQIEINR